MSIARGVTFTLPFLSLTTAGEANTTVTPVIYLTKDGGAQTPATNAAQSVGQGMWKIVFTADEMGADVVGWIGTGSGLLPAGSTIVTEADYTTVRAGKLDRLDANVSDAIGFVVQRNVTGQDAQVSTFNVPFSAAGADLIRAGMLVSVYSPNEARIIAYSRVASVGVGFNQRIVTIDNPIFLIAGTTYTFAIYRFAAAIADYQQRAVAVTLPDPAPDGYGGSGGGGGTRTLATMPLKLISRDGSPLGPNNNGRYEYYVGDSAPDMTVKLVDSNNTPIDITGATIEFKMRQKNGGAEYIGAGEVLYGAGGEASFDLTSTQFATSGIFDVTWRFVISSTIKITIGGITVEVKQY